MASESRISLLFVTSSFPENDSDWKSVFIAQMLSALGKRNRLNINYWGPLGIIPDQVTSLTSGKDTVFFRTILERGGLANLFRKKAPDLPIILIKWIMALRAIYARCKNDVAIFHINWIQNVIPTLGMSKPVLVTVLGSDLKLLKNPIIRFITKKSLTGKKCIIAPNAKWMVPFLEEKFGDIAEIRFLPLAVDDHWYQINCHRQSTEKFIWLVVLRITPQKIGRLFEWGDSIFTGKHQLHVFGPMQQFVSMPDWVTYHGAVTPLQLAEEWFPRATGLISLSEHDEGCPQIFLEAMAAGLPIIASKIPGHMDTLIHLESGYLVSSKDELGAAVVACEDCDNRTKIGDVGRARVMESHGNWQKCAERYERAYLDLLDRRESND